MSDKIKDHVQHIVNTIENGLDSYENEGQLMDGYEYISDALDIEYIVNKDKEILGARILVAFGGPNIWINTRTKQVEGYWWGDSCIMSYDRDEMDIAGAVESIYEC